MAGSARNSKVAQPSSLLWIGCTCPSTSALLVDGVGDGDLAVDRHQHALELDLAGVGIDGAFALSVVLYAFALVAAVCVRYRNNRAVGRGSVLARIAEGLAMVRGDRRLVGTLTVTVIYNVFAWPFTSMIPVIGRDRLALGPEGVGVLASLDGVGAFCGALILAVWLEMK